MRQHTYKDALESTLDLRVGLLMEQESQAHDDLGTTFLIMGQKSNPEIQTVLSFILFQHRQL